MHDSFDDFVSCQTSCQSSIDVKSELWFCTLCDEGSNRHDCAVTVDETITAVNFTVCEIRDPLTDCWSDIFQGFRDFVMRRLCSVCVCEFAEFLTPVS